MSGAQEEVKPLTRIDSYIFDERFYRLSKPEGDVFFPSVTYILGCAYPMDFGLIQWRGELGNKRADEIVEEAAADGSYVHAMIEGILKGGKVERAEIEAKFPSKRALKIMRCLKAFLDWAAEYKPVVESTEYQIYHEADRYAGTVDLKCKIGDERYIIDFKTSKSIHDSHKAQLCAYGKADPVDKLAILQLGNTTKKRYSFLVLDDEDRVRYTKEFEHTNALFQILNPDARPSLETFPDIFIIN